MPNELKQNESILVLMNQVREMTEQNKFGRARKLIEQFQLDHIEEPASLIVEQQLAFTTYKDVDLAISDRLDHALEILTTGVAHLDESEEQETLGIAGAIMKRKWEVDGVRKNLELSCSYYIKGYSLGGLKDNGYTAVNAAFVLDLLATQEDLHIENKFLNNQAKTYRAEASRIRHEIIIHLKGKLDDKENPLQGLDSLSNSQPLWWLHVTLAEAYFGVDRFDEAERWLLIARKSPMLNHYWNLESCSRQLAQIALMQKKIDLSNPEISPAWKTLLVLFDNPEEARGALTTTFSGKAGLALSGGGFRASLYHIGVLARLAELDMLRRVEVLSCVSGGSIIGAYYYLKVKELFERKTDAEISKDDYVKLVGEISCDFLTGIQKNIRMRVLSNWFSNLKMIFLESYSRTNRLGELYEEILFKPIFNGKKNEIWLNHLFIHPMESLLQEGVQKRVNNRVFNPKADNWRRQAKIPILILNATTLNTGHNWQFTARFMGESPASIEKIDGNFRLRRMYYEGTDGKTKPERKIRLGHAVAASSCVPGMFDPLSLINLYPDKTIKLVDGGVHDNQGVVGLLEQDCSVLLVSDSSGQMGSIDKPASSPFSVLPRTNDILMERVRNAQYQNLHTSFHQGRLKGLLFVHLKLGLDVELVDWVKCEDPQPLSVKPRPKLTEYNVQKEIQTLLAAVRTDLDSFNDTEARALMTSGYLMTKTEFSKNIPYSGKNMDVQPWAFLEIGNDLGLEGQEHLKRLLSVAGDKFFKVWKLSKGLRIVGVAAIVVAAITFLTLFIIVMEIWSDRSLLTVGRAGTWLIFGAAGFFVSHWLLKIVRFKDTLVQWLTGIGLITIGWLIINFHLHVLDRHYLRLGRRPR
jgi:predicted acylesterase/phospholipase RssA